MPITKGHILKKYYSVFNGIGTLPGNEYHIILKKDDIPFQCPPRSVPDKLKSAYKGELQYPCNEGIIMPVQEHTYWTNSIALVRKADSSLTLCLHPEDLNKNIERNQYYTRTIDNHSTEVHRSKYFTLMHAKSGYWMV